MKTNMEKAGEHKVKIAVTIAPEELDALLDDMNNGDGEAAADGSAHDLAQGVMERTAGDALEAAGVQAAADPEYLAASAPERGKEFAYDLLVTVKPHLGLTSYGPVSISVPAIAVSGDTIDDQLMQTVQEHAVFEQVAGRTKVQWGDTVELSADTTVKGGKFPPLCFEGARHELGDGLVPSGFDAQLVGMNSGTESVIEYELPSRKADASGDAKPRTARSAVKVGGIYRKVVPALSDAWVKKNIEGADTLDEYRQNIRRELLEQSKLERGSLVRGMCADALAARLDGAVPEEALEPLCNELRSRFEQDAARLGIDYDGYLEAQELTAEDVEAAIRFQAQQEVAVNYALDALAEHLGMQVEDADIDAFCEMIAPGQADQAKQSLLSEGRESAMREAALREKALRYLVENAQIDEIDSDEWNTLLGSDAV